MKDEEIKTILSAHVTPQLWLKGTRVPGAGYSPEEFQGRILCLLNGYLRLLTISIFEAIHLPVSKLYQYKTPF